VSDVWAVVLAAWLALAAALPHTDVRVAKACLDAPLAPGCMP
jgi:hypothetical protein